MLSVKSAFEDDRVDEGIPASEVFADKNLLFGVVRTLEMSQKTPHGFLL